MNTHSIEITPSNFETEILHSSVPALVDFWAPWCGPCRLIGPVVEEIATENQGRFVVGKINVDEHPQLGSQYGIRSIPALLFFKDGRVSNQIIGAASKAHILAALEALATSATVS